MRPGLLRVRKPWTNAGPLAILVACVLALTACSGGTPPDEVFRLDRNTDYDGEKLRFFVELDDGTELSVNTADDVYETQPGVTPMPGHQARAWTFLKIEGGDTSVAHALLSANTDDPTDYLVFGWWAYFPGQTPPVSFEGDERYSIIDGPELDHGLIPELPVDGSATYLGPAGGLYRYVRAVDEAKDEYLFVIDEYQGTVNLTADFEDGTLKGCIGCVGDLVTTRAHFGAFLGGELIDPGAAARDYELHLATAIIRDDGVFLRNKVILKHPERTITLSEGYWAGAFSSRQDSEGDPRLVAGFNYVDFKESDGSFGEFYGSFLGLSEPFRQTGVSGPLPEDGE
ncbi:MAG: hypothetical protein OXQ84_13850 [bacterium]|nr:hypothetical protein [bacterium]